MRFFLLYQNLLFYYDHEHSARPTGVIFLEGCYVERIIAPSTTANSVVLSQTLAKNMKEDRMQVQIFTYDGFSTCVMICSCFFLFSTLSVLPTARKIPVRMSLKQTQITSVKFG